MDRNLIKPIIKLRNFFWDIRYRIEGDAFEYRRTDDYCGVFPLDDITFVDLIQKIEKFEFGGKLPEKDCLFQYEEIGQICSFHWFITKEYQIHLRIFDDDRGDLNRALNYVVLHAHWEIRPDYNPLAHIQGIGFIPARKFVEYMRDHIRKV